MFFQIKQVSKVTLKVSIDIQKKLSNHLLFSDLDMIKKIFWKSYFKNNE